MRNVTAHASVWRIRSKGDAMQLGMAAVERHVAGLASKR